MSRAAGVLALAALLLPRTGSLRASQTTQVRVATHLVEIGVMVRDKNGPVRNLTKDDFVVLDRGKPQKISIFSAETAGPESPAQATLHPLSGNTFSNLPLDKSARSRSVTIVLLDSLNTFYGSSAESQYEKSPYWMEDLALRSAQLHLIEFIRQLQPQDRVAIYGLRHTLRVLCPRNQGRRKSQRPDLLFPTTLLTQMLTSTCWPRPWKAPSSYP